MLKLTATAATNLILRRSNSLYSVETVLNPANIEQCMNRFHNMQPIRLQTHEPNRRAAVLIPVCVFNGKVSLLYSLRAPHLKSHRGQVSFPGGVQDEEDRDLIETALRETHEELGINCDEIEVWGSGNTVVTRSDMSVLPVVGRIKGDVAYKTLKINPNEVEEVFAVSLEDLCNPKKIGHTQFKGVYSYSMPVFLGGKRRIWGLTAIITNAFLKTLLPPAAYNHKVYYNPPISGNRSKFQHRMK